MHEKLRLSALLSLAALLLLVGTPIEAAAQDAVGGPYTVDSATVVLLHFDGETAEEALTNESDSTADPIPNGSVTFLQENPIGEDMGSFLYLDNNAESDSSYLAIPDTSALDLTESWTMEAWVYILTYGDTNDDWRWRPKLLVKPGADVRSQSNYYNVLRGDLQAFNTGYWSPSGAGWTEIRSPNNSFQPGVWYHVTFIRDSEHNTIMQLVHDINRELIHFDVQQYDPITADPPNTTTAPAYIGINLGQGGGWLDGFIDEMRISNVVRPFTVPPIVTQVTNLANQDNEGPFEITANVRTLGDTDVQSVTLHYDDGSGMQDVAMSNTSGETYSASIPSVAFGSVVEYYVSAQVSEELRATVPSAAESDDPVRYRFAVVDPESHILHLDFEEGSGDVVNKGEVDLPIVMGGQPEYVEGNAAEGDYALRFDGESYLEVAAEDAVFLASPQFVIDMSFMAEDTVMTSGTRLIIHEGAGSWNNYNYHIWSTGGGDVTPASFFPESGVRNGGVVGPDTTIAPDEWYRVVYVLYGDTTYTRLYNADGELMEEVGGGTPGDVALSTGPFHIGGHGPAIEDGNADGLPDGPLFSGLMDNVNFYNYVPEEYQPTTVAAEDEELPSSVTLAQNYPNPFNPATTIEYTLPRSMQVTLALYDVLGRKVLTLVDERSAAGSHAVELNAENLASGLYLYRLETEEVTRVRQMLLVK